MTKKEPTCDCKNDPNNCPKDCKARHTHKTVICEICEPNAFKEEEPKQLLTLNNMKITIAFPIILMILDVCAALVYL